MGEGSIERARELVSEVSLGSLGNMHALGEEIGRRLLKDWPAFGQDADLEGEMFRAIYANLWQVFERVMPSGLGETLEAPPEALQFATAVLHRGIDTAELIQAYRVGQNMAWSWWMQRLAQEIEDRVVMIEAIELSSQRMFAYVDAVVDEQVRLWDEERQRGVGRAVAMRAEVVQRILRGEPLTLEDANHALGYSLDRSLLAAILWEEAPAREDLTVREDGLGREDALERDGRAESAMSRLEAVADAIAADAGTKRALLVPAGASSLWAWFTAEQGLAPEGFARGAAQHLGPGQGLALGLPGVGLEGLRSSHRQAQRARRIAEISEASAGVTRFDEVETLCVMSEDLELMADFVQRKLGALAARDRAAERLRATVLAWLQAGGNARLAAERLHAHRNTVLYRIQRAEEMLGRRLTEDRLGIELALTAAQRIGERVLSS